MSGRRGSRLLDLLSQEEFFLWRLGNWRALAFLDWNDWLNPLILFLRAYSEWMMLLLFVNLVPFGLLGLFLWKLLVFILGTPILSSLSNRLVLSLLNVVPGLDIGRVNVLNLNVELVFGISLVPLFAPLLHALLPYLSSLVLDPLLFS